MDTIYNSVLGKHLKVTLKLWLLFSCNTVPSPFPPLILWFQSTTFLLFSVNIFDKFYSYYWSSFLQDKFLSVLLLSGKIIKETDSPQFQLDGYFLQIHLENHSI